MNMKLIEALIQWNQRSRKLRQIAPNDLISEKRAKAAQKWIDSAFKLAEKLREEALQMDIEAEIAQDRLNEATIMIDELEGEDIE